VKLSTTKTACQIISNEDDVSSLFRDFDFDGGGHGDDDPQPPRHGGSPSIPPNNPFFHHLSGPNSFESGSPFNPGAPPPPRPQERPSPVQRKRNERSPLLAQSKQPIEEPLRIIHKHFLLHLRQAKPEPPLAQRKRHHWNRRRLKRL
jgi:hypothetical protein